MAVPLSGKARVAISARGRRPFRGVEPMHVAATNGRAAFSAGDLNFAARSLALKKKGKKKKKKKRQRKARELKSKARGSRCNRPLTLVRAHRVSVKPAFTPETPCLEQAGPQAQRPSGAWGPPGSRLPLGQGSPWHCRRRCRRAISKRESSSAAPLGGRPGGEGPAFSRRRPLAASPGLRAMPPAV